jgi:hypothetical protein
VHRAARQLEPERPPSRGGGGAIASEPAAEALCRGCRYSLQKLPANRCPECGLPFDPDDVETMHLPTWSGFLARRFLPAARWPMYVWPAVTAGAVLLAVHCGGPLRIGADYFADVRVPAMSSTLYVELWPLAIWSWQALLIAWIVRAGARVQLVMAYHLPLNRLRRDRRARRWTCACFLFQLLPLLPALAPTTDRCSHGEFWELWRTVGVARECSAFPGEDFHAVHAWVSLPLGSRWYVYVR